MLSAGLAFRAACHKGVSFSHAMSACFLVGVVTRSYLSHKSVWVGHGFSRAVQDQ